MSDQISPAPVPEKHREICGAKTKAGTPCQRAPMANGRCSRHGGKTLRGIASPTFKHGRASKYMPTRLLGKYEEAMKDPELLNLRSDIAVVEARLAELMETLSTGESGALWKAASSAALRIKDLQAAMARPNVTPERLAALQTEVAALTSVLVNNVAQGARDVDTWAELLGTMEQKRRIVESERRRLVDMNQMITAESAMGLIVALGMVVKRYVTDRKVLQQISVEFARLSGIDSRQHPVG